MSDNVNLIIIDNCDDTVELYELLIGYGDTKELVNLVMMTLIEKVIDHAARVINDHTFDNDVNKLVFNSLPLHYTNINLVYSDSRYNKLIQRILATYIVYLSENGYYRNNIIVDRLTKSSTYLFV